MSVPVLEFGVLDDARARQHRRRLGFAAATLAVVALAVGASVGSVGNRGRGPASPRRSAAHLSPIVAQTPAVAFAQDPSMGVACRVPNWIGCDRVGLAVWLRRPAVAVSATIAGAPLRLNDPTWSGPVQHGRRTMFAGFLQPAGLVMRLGVKPEPFTQTWLGSDQPTPSVQFRIDYGRDKVALVDEKVGLRAGWG